MSFAWADYVEVAEALVVAGATKAPKEEAYWRASVSRAYYGAFCTAREFRENRGDSFGTTERIHEAVILAFRNSTSAYEKKIGAGLDSIRASRRKAVYDRYEAVEKRNAETSVALAKRILGKLAAAKR